MTEANRLTLTEFVRQLAPHVLVERVVLEEGRVVETSMRQDLVPMYASMSGPRAGDLIGHAISETSVNEPTSGRSLNALLDDGGEDAVIAILRPVRRTSEAERERAEAARERARRDASGLPDFIHDAIADVRDSGHASCCGDPYRLDIPPDAVERLEKAIREYGAERERRSASPVTG